MTMGARSAWSVSSQNMAVTLAATASGPCGPPLRTCDLRERVKFLRRAGQMPNDRMFLAWHFSYTLSTEGRDDRH
jgi:hypothetical protein